MKTFLNRLSFLLISVALFAAQPVRLFAAAYDISTSQKNTSDNAWKNVIFSPVASGVWTFDSSKNPTSTATTGSGSIARAISPTFTGTIGAVSLTLSDVAASTGLGTGALQVTGGIYAGQASVFDGKITGKAAINTFGVGGSGTDNAIIEVAGSSASSYGAAIRFIRNTTNLWVLGHYSGIQGGTSDDLLLYNTTAGGEAARFASADFSVVFGPGGSGTNNSAITVSGSSLASYGAQIKLRRGATNYWTLGHYSGIQGGASNDLLLYNPVAGNEALKVASADSTATFAGQINATLGTNLLPQTVPATPASGWTLYTDSGDGNKLKAKASTGTIITLGTP